jgi:RNA polymerase sigma-70 factor (ECF subfamily)
MNGSSRPDVVLLRAARAGDGEAFGEFYTRRRALLLAYLRPRVTDPETAADLMAESFAAALLALRDSGRAIPDEPAAWLLTIARNKLIDSVRRGRVEQNARERLAMEPLEMDDEDIARIESLASSVDVTASADQVLSVEQRELLKARIVDERDYADIAHDLRCSEAVVRKRVSRALKALRADLEASE